MENKYEIIIEKFHPDETIKIGFNTDIDNRIWVFLSDGSWHQITLYHLIKILEDNNVLAV